MTADDGDNDKQTTWMRPFENSKCLHFSRCLKRNKDFNIKKDPKSFLWFYYWTVSILCATLQWCSKPLWYLLNHSYYHWTFVGTELVQHFGCHATSVRYSYSMQAGILYEHVAVVSNVNKCFEYGLNSN
jgi:hypothetical protein